MHTQSVIQNSNAIQVIDSNDRCSTYLSSSVIHTPVITHFTLSSCMHGANLNVREGQSGYLYTNDLLQLEACRAQRLSRLSADASAIVTPLVPRA